MGGWRKLHTEDLHNLHILLNIVRMMTSKIGWKHVACREIDKCIQNFS